MSTADQHLLARISGICSRHCARGEIDDLDAAVAELAVALCTPAADTARATKELLLGAPGRRLEEQAAAEIAVQARLQRGRGSASW